MTMHEKPPIELDPQLDLVLERVVDVPKELVWKAWTEPEHIKKWFVPKPWSIADCDIDLRPGGRFRTVMRSPDGRDHESAGCYLEICENERLVWTSALAPGFRPLFQAANDPGVLFTAIVMLESVEGGTKYTVIAVHGDETGKSTHEDMGFLDGWGTCLDQLVECIQRGQIA